MKRTVLVLLAIVVVLSICLVAIDPLRYWVMNNAGRYHIVLLHFPVGLLWMASLMEGARLTGWQKLSREAVGFVLGVGTLGAVVTAVTGWILHFEGGYDDELLEWHEKLGIATALLSVVTLVLHRLEKVLAYRVALGLTTVLVTVAGHLGGSLTHGEGFLTEELGNFSPRESTVLVASEYDEARVFPDLIHPILEGKCLSCHNEKKQKGGIILTDSMSIMAGGDHGPILVPGQAASSELVEVLEKEMDDDEHMPPKGRVQLTTDEIEVIKWWVNSGAPFSKKVSEVPQSGEVEEYIQKVFQPVHPVDLLGVEPADPAVVAELQADGFRILQPDPAKPWLWVNLSDEPELSVDRLEELDAIAEQISDLDLGNTGVGADHLAWVNDLPHLRGLKLDGNRLNASSFAELTDLAYLESLNLYQNDLGDLDEVPDFPQLKLLHAWESGLPEATLQAWQKENPQLKIESTDLADIFPAQAMIPPEFSVHSPFFSDELFLALDCNYPGVDIRWTSDGSLPDSNSKVFEDSIHLPATLTIKAQAYLENWEPSPVISQTYLKVLPVTSYQQSRPPDEQYPGEGSQGLTDLKIGKAQFTDAQWTGYWGRNCQLTLELAKADTIHGVAIHALEEVKSWILYPKQIIVRAGTSPSNVKTIAQQSFDLTQEDQKARPYLFEVDLPPTYAQFVKIEVVNYGKLPAWHESAGQDAWLFVDEVAVY